MKGLCRVQDEHDPLNRAVIDTALRLADTALSSVLTLDIGDRHVEMSYPGRGQTDGDILVRVPDVDVVFAGDLVEESAGDHPTVVPGHGLPVDLTFVGRRHADVGAVADTITLLFGSGVPVDEALERGEWPWDVALLGNAVRRGYGRLAPARRRA